MKSTRKKRIVEIYFILYLAALVLLLPNSKDHIKKSDKDNQYNAQAYNFSLQPEKNNLYCKVEEDSSGLKIIDLDSVNTIYYSGDVDDVHFEFVIEDQTINQSLKLSLGSKMSTKYFRITENPQNRSASFYWIPPLYENSNKSYLVQVYATGKPHSIVNSDNFDRDETPSITIKTQFTLNLLFINESGLPLAPMSVFGNPTFTDTSKKHDYIQGFSPVNTGNFSLFPEQPNINKISLQNWTNVIYANNVNLTSELSGVPQIDYVLKPDENNGGFASIQSIQDNKLVVSGRTPSYGTMKVLVKIKRKYDGQEFTASFIVSPSMIEQPVVPKIIYPEKTIIIDPRLPIADNAKAYLKFKDKILAVSNAGENISFTTDISFAGKELSFERYIDDNLYGQKYIIRVENYPDPEISEIQPQSNNEVMVITRSFGIFDKKENEIVKFIVDGNAKYQDLRGSLRDVPEQQVRLQYFRFVPKSPEKPFEFKIKAVDRRGIISEQKSYNQK